MSWLLHLASVPSGQVILQFSLPSCAVALQELLAARGASETKKRSGTTSTMVRTIMDAVIGSDPSGTFRLAYPDNAYQIYETKEYVIRIYDVNSPIP